MFGFEQNTETEIEFGFCKELTEVAEELDIDTSSLSFGLSEDLDEQSLLAIKAALEEAIEQANQEKLRQMGRCCMGYKWLREGAGYRCAGGSHYVTDEQLKAGDDGRHQ